MEIICSLTLPYSTLRDQDITLATAGERLALHPLSMVGNMQHHEGRLLWGSTAMNVINWKSRFLDQIEAGEFRVQWNASGTRVLRYCIDFKHNGLNTHKEVTAIDPLMLQSKVDVLMVTWDERYHAALRSRSLSRGKDLAQEMAADADRIRSELRFILQATLNVNDSVDWDSLKSVEAFKKEPLDDPWPDNPRPEQPPEPPPIGFFYKLFGGSAKKLSKHESEAAAVRDRNERKKVAFEKAMAERRQKENEWNDQQRSLEEEYLKDQAERNAKIEEFKARWEAGDTDAIIEHAALVLDSSALPDLISKNYDLAYHAEGKTLLVEYQLPDPDDLPTTKTVRFATTTGEFQETKISQKEAKDLFDTVCYQLCLRTIHEIFEADTHNHIEQIVFNGFTDSVDKSTGKNTISVIMSLMTNKKDFLELDLGRVDPRACFKTLKGVAASSLSGLAAVAPIMEIDRNDRRFINSKHVEIDDASTNLAAMDWEDFEHLVRQLFEKEFASRGGEVKVTQASADGGVDAIAFDPDPITGGKIIIQAKRYTKTVGVSAVRDLYGTVMSEGASKGILVTTADYGPDAHKFAAGKPITLLSGSHMLHLLAKHGTKAKIDLKEARKELGLK